MTRRGEAGSVESADADFVVRSKDSWAENMAAVRQSGADMASKLRAEGHQFKLAILAPREMVGGGSVPLSAVAMDLDWTIATRLEMVESARDMITNAYMIDSLDPAFPTVLASIINGKGLYAHGVGEFFLLYGRFEEKHRLTKPSKTRAKMVALVNGDERYLKPYKERGKTRRDPLPYAVRNILGHVGSNPNNLDREGRELRTAIDLLREWVEPQRRR